MFNVDAIKCANHLSEQGLKFVGTTRTLSYFVTHRLTESRLFDLEHYELRFEDNMKEVPTSRILKECRNCIYEFDDYRDVIKMFLKREYNKRMNEEEGIELSAPTVKKAIYDPKNTVWTVEDLENHG